MGNDLLLIYGFWVLVWEGLCMCGRTRVGGGGIGCLPGKTSVRAIFILLNMYLDTGDQLEMTYYWFMGFEC